MWVWVGVETLVVWVIVVDKIFSHHVLVPSHSFHFNVLLIGETDGSVKGDISGFSNDFLISKNLMIL